jgi:hypothetical protein
MMPSPFPHGAQRPAGRARSARRCAFWVVATLALPSLAQPAFPENWAEQVVPPPARFSVERLQPFEVSAGSSLRYGIDPDTLRVDPDGVVRYVLVARSDAGALNVLYEGIHCKAASVKTYARWDNQSAWNTSADPAWRPLAFSGPTRHAMRLARGGLCEGPTPNGTPAQMLRTLQAGGPPLR